MAVSVTESEEYVLSVFEAISDNPTAVDLDKLIEMYSVIGFYEAQAMESADMKELVRKHAEAQSIVKNKSDNPKMTAAELESQAILDSASSRRREIEARGYWRKMSNLRQSVEQAINGVKFIGRVA